MIGFINSLRSDLPCHGSGCSGHLRLRAPGAPARLCRLFLQFRGSFLSLTPPTPQNPGVACDAGGSWASPPAGRRGRGRRVACLDPVPWCVAAVGDGGIGVVLRWPVGRKKCNASTRIRLGFALCIKETKERILFLEYTTTTTSAGIRSLRSQ